MVTSKRIPDQFSNFNLYIHKWAFIMNVMNFQISQNIYIGCVSSISKEN